MLNQNVLKTGLQNNRNRSPCPSALTSKKDETTTGDRSALVLMKTDNLKDIIDYGDHEAIKHWLKISGLKPYSASTKQDFYKLLERHLGEGKIRLDQLRRLTLELKEYGGKRVYVGNLSNFKTIKLRERFEQHLKQLGHRTDAEPKRVTLLPSKPHLDYIWWSPKEVRIGYCETHESTKPDRSTMTLVPVYKTNYITISVDPGSGAVKIMMDAPGEKHPHQGTFPGEVVRGYVAFYRDAAVQLLGADDFRGLDLLKIAKWIASQTTLFERKRAIDLTAQHSRVITISRSEVTDDPAYTAGAKVDGKDRVYAGLAGYWLPEGSEKQLHREIFMHLSQPEDMLQFPGINLASEVEYALSRIRSV
jgi:hypothetical protein